MSAERTWLVADVLEDPGFQEVVGRRGAHIYEPRHPAYPLDAGLPGRPAALVGEGARPDAFTRPTVAVVGTRAATPHGLADAAEIGAALAEAGVTVVSGMAIGVDGAAHAGALDAGGLVVGVVGTGLDVVYPRRHERLFERARASGVLLSEYAYGVGPRREHFPVRNRIIAGLADVTVVVEATASGGARITADLALGYGRDVFAVPGSRRNPSAAGCNALIADGAHPLLDPSDILLALGLTQAGRADRRPERRPTPTAEAARVLAALGGESAGADQLSSRTGYSPARVSLAVAALERDGWVERSRGLVWAR